MMKVLVLLAVQPLIVFVTVQWMIPSSIGNLVTTAVAYPTTSTWSNIPISSSSSHLLSFHRRLAFMTKDVTTRRSNQNDIYARRKLASLYQQIQRPTSLSSSLSYKASSTSTSTTTALYYTNQNIDETTTTTTTTNTVSSTPSTSLSSTTVVTTIESISLTGVIVDITFSLHRPLGCIIEESLVTSAGVTTSSTTATTSTNMNKNHIVFITSITSNGNAEQAGLLVGDVILGVSTVFTTTTPTTTAPTTSSSSSSSVNETCNSVTSASSTSTIMDVTGFGIDRVKSLIMCRYDNEPFTLRVLRGTTALQDHEVALTELCSNPDTTSTEAEQCMIDYIQGGYATIPDQKSLGTTGSTSSKQINIDRIPDDGECLLDPNNDDDDSECLLNDMHSLWASDLPMSSSQQQQQQQQGSVMSNENSNTDTVPVKPWSSRASPSGTFVRDPITGKMKNLDSTN